MAYEFVGDDEGNVTVKFTAEALTLLIERWNHALPFDESGLFIVTLHGDEFEPGKVHLVASVTARDAA